MKSKLLITIVIILIVGLGAFTFLGNKKSTPITSVKQSEPIKSQQAAPSATETNKQAANIILGNSGFVPKDITVKKGTTLIWINKSGKTATVNSDDHPSHLLYPFLNLGEFANSTILQVVAEKIGKYNYHNHLNPSETGTVIVE